MELTREMTLNQITDAVPATFQILTELGFDTCCGGAEAIGPAADRKGIAWEKVIAALAPAIWGA